jgi:uncharacterized membrane protein YkvA (DUF1232 family)
MTDQPVDLGKPAQRSGTGRGGGFWRRSRRFIRHLPLVETTFAAYYCARDPATPLHARVALFGAIGYFIMPFDLIPDFIPFVAHIDDAAVMVLAVRSVTKHIKTEHRASALRRLDRFTE